MIRNNIGNSFLSGFGRSLTYAPAVMMVGIYFNKKRGIAVGLGTSGVGFGSFVAPAVVEMAFHFYGYSGGFYILACFAINLCISGMLYRPLQKQRLLMAYDKRQEVCSILMTLIIFQYPLTTKGKGQS